MGEAFRGQFGILGPVLVHGANRERKTPAKGSS
jgi:hypothetical protein